MLTDIRPIRTEADHEAAVAEIWRLMEKEPEPGSLEGDRLEVLALLSEAYEAKHHPIGPADPIDAIEFMMEQKGLDRSDLEPALGQSGRVSEVLRRKRPLSIGMIRALVDLLGVPADVLVRSYPLSTDPEAQGEGGAVVHPFRKRQATRHSSAASSGDKTRTATAAKRASGMASKKSAAKWAAAAGKPAAAKRSAGSSSKQSRGVATKRPSSGSGRGGRPTGSKR